MTARVGSSIFLAQHSDLQGARIHISGVACEMYYVHMLKRVRIVTGRFFFFFLVRATAFCQRRNGEDGAANSVKWWRCAQRAAVTPTSVDEESDTVHEPILAPVGFADANVISAMHGELDPRERWRCREHSQRHRFRSLMRQSHILDQRRRPSSGTFRSAAWKYVEKLAMGLESRVKFQEQR